MGADDEDTQVECPECRSPAVYRYGKSRSRQRYLCVMCGRQFIPGRLRHHPRTRPDCPRCGAKMHLFKRKGEDCSVFRCSRYPDCRTYVRVAGTFLSEKRRNGE